MERYKTAAAQAKSKGDDRKARMHERIVKVRQPPAPPAGVVLPAPPRPCSASAFPSSNTRTPSGRTKQGKRWISRSCPFRQVFFPVPFASSASRGRFPKPLRRGEEDSAPSSPARPGSLRYHPAFSSFAPPLPRLPAHPGRGDAVRRPKHRRSAGNGHEAGQPGGPRGGGRHRGGKGRGSGGLGTPRPTPPRCRRNPKRGAGRALEGTPGPPAPEGRTFRVLPTAAPSDAVPFCSRHSLPPALPRREPPPPSPSSRRRLPEPPPRVPRILPGWPNQPPKPPRKVPA